MDWERMKHRLIEEEIRSWFLEGIQIDPFVQAYLRSTFAATTPVEILSILDQEAGCEKDTLMDLLFFPDETIRIRLEKILDRYSVDEPDVQIVARLLIEKQPQAIIRFPEIGVISAITVPDFLIQNLLARLRLSEHLNQIILHAIDTHVPETDTHRIRVKIRNAGFSADCGSAQFLSRFFETIRYHEIHFSICLEFILLFLSEGSCFDDVRGALFNKRRRLVDQLGKEENFHNQLRKVNMEIMMLSGRKEPGIDREQLFETIRIIDLLTGTLFGQVAIPDGFPESGFSRSDYDLNYNINNMLYRPF